MSIGFRTSSGSASGAVARRSDLTAGQGKVPAIGIHAADMFVDTVMQFRSHPGKIVYVVAGVKRPSAVADVETSQDSTAFVLDTVIQCSSPRFSAVLPGHSQPLNFLGSLFRHHTHVGQLLEQSSSLRIADRIHVGCTDTTFF